MNDAIRLETAPGDFVGARLAEGGGVWLCVPDITGESAAYVLRLTDDEALELSELLWDLVWGGPAARTQDPVSYEGRHRASR